MIRAECVRCSYRVEVPTAGETRQEMLRHSEKSHPIPLPSWIEDDGEVITRHGMAALQPAAR